MKKALFFSLKIYLTTAALGPVFTLISLIIYDPDLYAHDNPFDTFFYTILIAIVLFIPSWLITSWLIWYMMRKRLKPNVIKFRIAIAGFFFLLFTVSLLNLSFFFGGGAWSEVIPIFLCYISVLMVSVYLFRLPLQTEFSSENIISKQE